jgi:hypothetical protein
LAAATQHWSDAARLLALAQELRSQSGTQLPPERAEDEAALQQNLRQQLGESHLSGLLSDARRLDETGALVLARQLLENIRRESVSVSAT